MARILMADDHPIFLAGLTRVLQRSNYEVDTATDGQEALDQIRDTSPDLAILDIKMPKLDGLATLKELNARSPNTKVMLLSGFVDPDSVYQAIRMGAKGYILKSDPVDDILQAVQRVLNGEIVLPPEAQEELVSAITIKDDILTHRELEVLKLIANGMPSATVASTLFIALPTVKIHLNHIYKKLGVSSRAAAIHEAMRRGMVD